MKNLDYLNDGDFVRFDYNGKQRLGSVETLTDSKITLEFHGDEIEKQGSRFKSFTIAKIESPVIACDNPNETKTETESHADIILGLK